MMYYVNEYLPWLVTFVLLVIYFNYEVELPIWVGSLISFAFLSFVYKVLWKEPGSED